MRNYNITISHKDQFYEFTMPAINAYTAMFVAKAWVYVMDLAPAHVSVYAEQEDQYLQCAVKPHTISDSMRISG